MPEKVIDTKEFARRVERVCDFFLDQVPSNSEIVDDLLDVKVLQDLKEDAANLQYDNVQIISMALDGLSGYMDKS